jgi:hypothetical protein
MTGLLLKKNRPKLSVEGSNNKILLMKEFLGLYEKQLVEIEQVFSEWPAMGSDQKFRSVSKKEFMKASRRVEADCIVGVEENMDYQLLLRNESKLMFVGGGFSSSGLKGSGVIVVEVVCCRVKMFINSILKSQAGFFLDFCEKLAARDVRASTLRKASEQSWNIETILSFKNWINL